MKNRNARSQEALKAIQKLNFNELLYRGYWVKRSSFSGDMWIEKDNTLIHRIPSNKSWDHARSIIDQLC
jgi:hypothetical protein